MQRMPLVWFLCACLFLAIVIVFGVAVIAHGSTGSSCNARPGRSHGTVWWRYRIIDGRHCWYPGLRHRPRYLMRVASLRKNLNTAPAVSRTGPGSMVDSARGPVPVRTIPMSGGRYTPTERIERAFDRVMTFPTDGSDDD